MAESLSTVTCGHQVESSLPGFRFHPTEEELLNFYLKSVILGKKLPADIIVFLNIYNHHPRELPGLAKIGEREWYFFVRRECRKFGGGGGGGRPNRTTRSGFWKATGSDRKVLSASSSVSSSSSSSKMVLGLRKTLVFYEGRAPCGTKTDWVMNEYRLTSSTAHSQGRDDVVLCKVYRKATSLKVLEQKQMAAMEVDEQLEEEEEEEQKINANPNTTMHSSRSTCSRRRRHRRPPPLPPMNSLSFDQDSKHDDRVSASGHGREINIHVPPTLTMDWNQQDYSFWALECFLANVLPS